LLLGFIYEKNICMSNEKYVKTVDMNKLLSFNMFTLYETDMSTIWIECEQNVNNKYNESREGELPYAECFSQVSSQRIWKKPI